MAISKYLLIVVICLAASAFLVFDGQQYLSLGFFRDLYAQQPQLTALVYFLIYILVTGLSLPGAALLTIIGGMIFGLWVGIVIVSFASSIGATLAFLGSRGYMCVSVTNFNESRMMGARRRTHSVSRCSAMCFSMDLRGPFVDCC